MRFDQIHIPIKIISPIAIIIILLTCGFLPALGQDSSQNPPSGYHKGVWVLTNNWTWWGNPVICPPLYSISGNSITGRVDWTASCYPGGARPAYRLSTGTWTELPSVLYPGTKQETTMTVSIEGNPGVCSDGSWGSGATGYSASLHFHAQDFIAPDKYVIVDMTHADPNPAPKSEKVTWDVPWGSNGSTITISIGFSDGNCGPDFGYTYTYQEKEVSAPVSKPSGKEAENHPPTVTLSYSPSDPTDQDVIEFTAEASDPDGDELTFSWFVDDKEQSDTGSTMSTTLSPGDYTVTVKVSDGKGGTGEDSVHLTVTPSSGISGDVLEAVYLQPITDATVTVEDPDGNVIRRVPVDADGKYSVLLPLGTYRVWASAPGYLPSTGMSGAHVVVEQRKLKDGVNFRLVMEPANGGKPCTTKWIELGSGPYGSPCNVIAGPKLAPGSYMIWTAVKDGYDTKGLGPHDWKSYGPINLRGNHNYLVVMDEWTEKEGRVIVTEDDSSIDCFDRRSEDGQAYIYYRNDYLSYSKFFAILFCPVSGAGPDSDSESNTPEIRTKSFEFEIWGAYKFMDISGKRYFASYLEDTNQKMLDTGESIPFLWQKSKSGDLQKNGQLSEVLIDDYGEGTFSSDNPLKLKEGYELAIKSIDIYGTKAYLELSKNGQVVESKVIQPFPGFPSMIDRTYYYKSDLGMTKGIVQIAVHFKNAFRGANENVASYDGVFQISGSPRDI